MKTSVITTLIENIARLHEFNPEKDVLVKRVVVNIISWLKKQAAAVNRYTPEEKAVAIQMGVDTVVTEALIASPETEALLTKVGMAALAYYHHVDSIATMSEPTTLQ